MNEILASNIIFIHLVFYRSHYSVDQSVKRPSPLLSTALIKRRETTQTMCAHLTSTTRAKEEKAGYEDAIHNWHTRQPKINAYGPMNYLVVNNILSFVDIV